MAAVSFTSFFPAGRPFKSDSGLRPHAGGTHTSRTIMLAELSTLLSIEPQPSGRAEYAELIIQDNRLGKQTAATRRLSYTRLGELYALDPTVPLFRILRRLWRLDETSRPLLALLTGLARDPLLLATAPAILQLRTGEEMQRGTVRAALVEAVGDRLSAAVLDKVLRNTASSWTQSGHLIGRTFKHRQQVTATPTAVAFALWIACQAGFSDTEAFQSGWVRTLDLEQPNALHLAGEARRLRLLDMDIAENVVTLDFVRLDGTPWRR
jgi:hypothetical protein